uniref:exonuclease domain-containing protein n=1 Tax=Ningiella ruwaisensis TaxID=2364274 RepID=UPI00109EE5D5|nr:exonuclease domain-containing protein [Ningiella ruwaisensis]
MKKLPTYYYLSHFHEFLSFVKGPCADLLHGEHLQFIDDFHAADKNEQCTLVRCINRKHSVIKVASLRFEELPDINLHIEALVQRGWLSNPKEQDKQAWINSLTKEELLRLYQKCSNASCETPAELEQSGRVSLSLPRASLVEACMSLEASAMCNSDMAGAYIVRRIDPIIDYFLFLFFGNIKARLNQFSLRDLGVMNTRDEKAQMESRFDCKDAALSSFRYSTYLSSFRRLFFQSEQDISEFLGALPAPVGQQASEKQHQLLFEAGKTMLQFNASSGLSLLALSDAQDAQEKWCREAYKQGKKDAVKEKLLAILENPGTDKLLAFAEDFLARKYEQKRTSLLTDMLREGNQHLSIDETFRGNVERGVIAYYKNKGVQAYRTENRLFRSLFGLCLWQELFELPGLGLATQFDYLPNCLKQNNFYEQAGEAIEAKFSQINSDKTLMKLLSENAAKYYGSGQGIFNWRSDLLEQLHLLVQHTDVEALKQVLRRMSQDWQACHDGFPDIMVLNSASDASDKQASLHFEEIKAEGDVLRRNQLACIRHLKEVGIKVLITTVNFITDPDQPYVVVDIETTGGRSQYHKITEIGMVKLVRGEIVDSWQSLLNPQRRIPSNITALTGISDDMVQDAPLFADVADEIDAFTQDAIFVAHNVNFDYGFIREEYARIERMWRRPKLCTVQLMRRYYKGLPSYSLANLTKHFGIDMQRHHRAMSDALAASELLNLVNEKRFTQQNAEVAC